MKIETKYNYGDKVWFMEGNKAISNNVTEFSIDCNYSGGSDCVWGSTTFPIAIRYHFKSIPSQSTRDLTKPEHQLFPTKEELLKSL